MNPGEAEGLRDGGYRPRVLALVEECDALPEPAFRVGEPVEAFQGVFNSSALRRLSSLASQSLASRSWILLFGEYFLRLDILQTALPALRLRFVPRAGWMPDGSSRPARISPRADLQFAPAGLGLFEGLFQFADAVLEVGDLRPETLHHPLQILLLRRTSGTAWRPRAPSGGPCRRAARSLAECGLPQIARRAPTSPTFLRSSSAASRSSCLAPRRGVSSSWRALSALLSASLWAWMAATLLSADSFASASLVAWVFLRSCLAPLRERLDPPQILFAPFLRAAAGRLELVAQRLYLPLLRLYDVLEFRLHSPPPRFSGPARPPSDDRRQLLRSSASLLSKSSLRERSRSLSLSAAARAGRLELGRVARLLLLVRRP